MVALLLTSILASRSARAEEPPREAGLGCDALGCTCGYECLSNECVIVPIPPTCTVPNECGPECLGLTCSTTGTCVVGARDGGPDATLPVDATVTPDASTAPDVGSEVGVVDSGADSGVVPMDAIDIVARADGSLVEAGSEPTVNVTGGCACAASRTGRADGGLGMLIVACALGASARRRRPLVANGPEVREDRWMGNRVCVATMFGAFVWLAADRALAQIAPAAAPAPAVVAPTEEAQPAVRVGTPIALGPMGTPLTVVSAREPVAVMIVPYGQSVPMSAPAGIECLTPCTMQAPPGLYTLTAMPPGGGSRLVQTVTVGNRPVQFRVTPRRSRGAGIGLAAAGGGIAVVGITFLLLGVEFDLANSPGSFVHFDATPYYVMGGVALAIGVALIVPGAVLLTATGGGVEATVARARGPRLLGFGATPTAGGGTIGAAFAF